MTYNDTRKELTELKEKREEILEEIHEYEEKVADIFKTQCKRIKINMSKDLIIIDLSKNRHVMLTYSELSILKDMFDCEDLIITSPIRCKIEIRLLYSEDDNDNINDKNDTTTNSDTNNTSEP